MSDRFACGMAEQMIPRYVKGRCTEAEKKFLEKHCSECIECSVRLIHEKNRQEVSEDRQFDQAYSAESRDYTGASARIYEAGQESPSPEYHDAFGETLPEEAGSRRSRRGPGPGALVAAIILIISASVFAMAAVLFSVTGDLTRHYGLKEMLEDFKEDGMEVYEDSDDYEELSDYSGPVVLAQDHVMDWKDPALEEKIREITGIEEGDIMYSDVLSITWIDLSRFEEEETEITDISDLAEFRNLTALYLSDRGIEDISPLGKLTKLDTLYLYNNRIQDIGALRELKNLRYLSLASNQISDLEPLEDLTALEDLELDSNLITDIGPLRKLTNLETLDLSGNGITDITPLQDLRELELLNLSWNEIRDPGILKELPSLEYLYIADNPIEDETALSELDAEVYY